MPNPAHLIFVRHGETDWNVDQRMQGQSTTEPAPALTDTGSSQAHELAKHLQQLLAGQQPAAIVTSDLLRARQVCTMLKVLNDKAGCVGQLQHLYARALCSSQSAHINTTNCDACCLCRGTVPVNP